ncbi:MAG: site-specific integrase [Thaumarchaeota archaeon]|nr:site-specific integrase [Nitrososphaerota archaeon]
MNKKKNVGTASNYKSAINNFENFCMEKYGRADLIEDLKEYSDIEILDFIQAWIDWNDRLNPATVLNMFSRVKKYLHHRGIKLHPQDIKEELEFRRIIEEEMYPLTIENIQSIIKEMRHKHKVQFICQSSSLMRIGELVQLKKKHLSLDNKNIIVKLPANITKLSKGRTTFFSKEASKLLRPILKALQDEDLVFGTNEKVHLSETNSEQILARILEKIGLNDRYESNNRYKINTHSFRAFGITKLSRHDPNFAKKLAGQKGYLLQYDRMTDEEKLELYQKYEIDLIIDNTEKLKIENEKKSKEITELQSKSDRISELEKKFAKLAIRSNEHKEQGVRTLKEVSEGRLKIMTPSEIKQMEKDIASGKIKDYRKKDQEDYERKLEEKVRLVLSDPDILKKIMQD